MCFPQFPHLTRPDITVVVLNEEAKELLYGTDNGYIKITEENSGLVLNLLWALGLGNKNEIFEKIYGLKAFTFDDIYKQYSEYAEILKPYTCELVDFFYKLRGKKFLFEGY